MQNTETQKYPGYILITGAGSGIGLSIVEGLLTNGFRSIICQYRNRHQELFELLTEYGINPVEQTIQAELTDEADIQKIRDFSASKFGKIYGLVNVAGASTNSMSWKMSKDDFVKVINSNLLSTFLCSKAFIPEMREQNYGRIINFSSVVAFTGTVGSAHYCAAKAGVAGLSKALSVELANKSITVNTIALGYFDRGLIHEVPLAMQEEIKNKTPMKRFGEGSEVSSFVNYILDRKADFVTGQVLHINGGLY